ENPDTSILKRLVTVHPLGGCPMGDNAEEGVVDAWGEVFHYPGLYVADGSVMPGPVGSNPSLTIAAFSRRCAHGILARWRSSKNSAHASATEPASTSPISHGSTPDQSVTHA